MAAQTSLFPQAGHPVRFLGLQVIHGDTAGEHGVVQREGAAAEVAEDQVDDHDVGDGQDGLGPVQHPCHIQSSAREEVDS